jgi:NAD(P)-dependent dehydrogenase (short-subunit alcohol dehydrogenase family)
VSGVHPLFDLTGRVAVVTGGGKGIGKQLALGLAAAGADVVVASRTLPEVEATAAEIRALSRQAAAHSFDVTRPASSAALAEAVLAEFGRIDVLVNCAGYVAVRVALDVTEAEWDVMADTNLKGLFFCCQAVGRTMVERGQGKVINIASALGLVGLAGRAAYSATKGGVIQLTRVLAVEWAPYNVTVNAIAPTTTMTGETRHLYAEPAAYAEKAQDIPLQRLGTPDDLVGAVTFLAGAASDFMTGHTLVVDGGYSVR